MDVKCEARSRVEVSQPASVCGGAMCRQPSIGQYNIVR